MDDMLDIMQPLSRLQLELEAIRKAHFKELEELFYGVKTKDAKAADNAPEQSETSAVTPQQTKKRPKRLTALTENTDDSEDAPDVTAESSRRQSARLSNSQLLAIAEVENLNSTASLMPPPPAPTLADTTMSSGRPQRAAKLKTVKLLKEHSLIRKMRRPSEEDSIRVKVESEQRVSQINGRTHNIAPDPKPSVVEETKPQEAPPTLPIEPIKKPAEVFASKNVCVKVKRHPRCPRRGERRRRMAPAIGPSRWSNLVKLIKTRPSLRGHAKTAPSRATRSAPSTKTPSRGRPSKNSSSRLLLAPPLMKRTPCPTPQWCWVRLPPMKVPTLHRPTPPWKLLLAVS
ncbi:uncharacterized protein LOC117189823 [Drosophila miranda]|uniref:uncharacterized protein LOC117189823 n=1 Tax=Drosophila miranda TaxID=7229 RepID=UPI00143F06BD|nr:uncharacterized protein LOC117189823 [Drosophila miranda]